MSAVSSKSLPAMMTCECGETLNRMSIEDAYGKSVECDGCNKKLKKSAIAYHCISNHCFCISCSARKILTSVDNKGLVNPIRCACNEIMELSQPCNVYPSASAYCNNTTCRSKIAENEFVCDLIICLYTDYINICKQTIMMINK